MKKKEHEKEALMTFPCEYKLKVIGNHNDQFEIEVYTIVQKHVPNLAENCLQQKTSKEKKYLAINVAFTATSQKQLESIYADLKKCKDIIMTL